MGGRGTLIATVTSMAIDYAFAIDDHGERYFLYPRNFQLTLPKQFDALRAGDRVEFIPIQHPKGWRGIEIRVLPD